MSEMIVQPGDNLQNLVTANPAGTVFLIRGTHQAQSAVLRKPQHDGDQFIGENAVLDGAGKEFAFSGIKGADGAQDIIIRNLAVTGYKPAAQNAAIRPYGYAWRWTLEDLNIYQNANWGVMVDKGWQVRRCHVHHNGTMGMGGGGGVVEDCELDNNNTSGADSHWEAGGCKFVYCTGMIVRRNHVHHNKGPGIWFDGNSTGALIQDNDCEDNWGPGIDWEINRGATIEGNNCLRNGLDENWANDYDLGGGGILILNGAEVIIRNNTLLDNKGGVGLVNAVRSGFPSLDNIEVCGNIIGYSARLSGIAAGDGASVPGPDSVRFYDNRYQVDPNRAGFRVGNTYMNLAGWTQRYPTDRLYEEPVEPPPPPPLVKPAKPIIIGVYRSIEWGEVDCADRYTVQQRQTDGTWATVANTPYSEWDAPARGRYRLRAVNGAGGSAWTSILV